MKNNKKIKLALINPKGRVGGQNSKFAEYWAKEVDPLATRHSLFGLSVGILTIAGLTPPDTFDVEIIDEHFEGIEFTKKFDLVGVSAITQQADRAYQIADRFRSMGVFVVMGGIHATVMPEEAKQHADSVIVGEAEMLWGRFLEDFLQKKTKDFYRNCSEVDLSKGNIPRYDLLKKDRYKIAWVQTTRGCPHDCEFCVASKVYGKKYRYKPVNQVLAEIGLIKKIWKNPQVGFADDNMFTNRAYAKELVDRITPLGVRWATQTDVSIANDEIFLKSIKKSGCFMFFIGFESVYEGSLNTVNKNKWKKKYFKDYSEIIKKIQSHGIGVLGSFIVGFDTDTQDVFGRVSDFIIDNNLYGASISVLTPLPGSVTREKLKKQGRLLPTQWNNYTFFDVNYRPKQMTVAELEEGLLSIYKRVYSRESNIKRFKYFKQLYSNLS